MCSFSRPTFGDRLTIAEQAALRITRRE